MESAPNTYAGQAAPQPLAFETDPARYRHWSLSVDANSRVARLGLAVREDEPLRPGYTLKLNSYDLGVDIELADAVQRLRFTHPQVRTVIVTSDRDRVFCAGANIHMLASSDHGFKVNFCKYTNETRLAIEDASAHSGQRYLAAVNGSCAGGGYELALACDEILLIDDGSSTVSLPEVALLGVLPGTGGLTRIVDKRMVRRDRADFFCALAEGMRGKRAVDWHLIDGIAPRSRFAAEVETRAKRMADEAAGSPAGAARKDAQGVKLEPLEPAIGPSEVRYRFVALELDRKQRLGVLRVTVPAEIQVPRSLDELHGQAREGLFYPLRLFRELEDALLRLRFNEPAIGLVLLRTQGSIDSAERSGAPSIDKLLALDAVLHEHRGDWLAAEVLLYMARVLRRLDQTARSLYALGEPGSCFAGALLELLLAADRSYFLDDPGRPVQVAVSALNGGTFPMATGLSRLQARFLGQPGRAEQLLQEGLAQGPWDAQAADRAGLVTVLSDELDYDDTLRLSIEERLSLSPDALTGMEASLRFPGSEGCQSKIFGRLSAWQNWIFTRPNATGPGGALTRYGHPERPSFDFRRT